MRELSGYGLFWLEMSGEELLGGNRPSVKLYRGGTVRRKLSGDDFT